MNELPALLASMTLVLGLYVAKAWIFAAVESELTRFACCFAAIAVSIPLLWLFWRPWEDHVDAQPPIYWIGIPIGFLLIPILSMANDFLNDRRTTPACLPRALFELLIIAPIWFIVWAWIQFFVLGWVSI